MSKAMPTKKKPQGTTQASSTDSSSGSSSDSSSSSSSSSGSDSSSSSDSESTSDSSAKHSNTDQKKPSSTVPKPQRKSTDNKSSSTTKPTEKQKPKVSTKPPKQIVKASPFSSDDEDVKVTNPNKNKKKSVVKPKSTATVTPKTAPAKPTGGKVPPKANPAAAKTQHNKNSNREVKTPKPSKSSNATSNQSKLDANKKKSIFSPENSSESDGNEKAIKAQALKNTAPKPRPKASAKPVEKPKPVAKKPESKQPKSKEIVSSATSASSTTDSSSSSDSESSAESTTSNKKSKQKNIKKTPVKDENSDSETEAKKVTRKLTRSANTRKSKHVLGKNVYTDTDSDTESTKRSLSRSPVKRAPVSTKGKAKNKKNDAKTRNAEVAITEERKCPLEGCNSMGHLSGRQDKHFTIDACPSYHNMTGGDCKDGLVDRKKREDVRRKLIDTHKKSPRNQSNPEQKSYLQRIRESRSKFKFDLNEEAKIITDKNREPNLENFVPEYDLKLFRDAQALASEKIEDELKTQPNTKGTKYIEMGKFEMEVWYQSPYPEEFARLPKLYICEYCLRYMRGRTVLQRHAAKCVWRHPPGEEVYRKDKISVWEVDGKRYKQYCQNLCLLAKFFLDHKTLYYDVEPFLFYVMTMLDIEGCHTVGYFSKEKNSFLNYNVSCILTLPPYQRQGYGRLLIDFSYLLTRVEGKIGSPEKPLSDLGLISYRSYWKDVLLGYLCSRAGTQLSVKDISQEMAIHSTDIVSTLQALGMMKYWKGKHIILKKQDVLDEYVDRVKRRGSLLKEVDPTCLRWTPFVPPQPNPS